MGWRDARKTLARSLLCSLLALPLACQTPGHGQTPTEPPARAGSRDGKPNIDLVEWGWGRADEGVQAEMFIPVTVWISSGEKPWSGLLRLRHQQDRTQDALVEIPVSTTPSRSIPIELTVVLPSQCHEATVELIGNGERDTRKFATFAGPDQLGMPLASIGAPRVLIVGDSSARSLRAALTVEDVETDQEAPSPLPPSIVNQWGRPETPTDPREAFWHNAVCATVRADRLPLAWAAYEGLALVVLAPDAWDAMDSRARTALQTWVWSGGRVLVEVAPAGNAWANFFPEWSGETPVALGEQARISNPARLFDLPTSLAAVPPSQRVPDASGPPTLGRRIELTARGRADGWKILWASGDDPESGTLAVGPSGFGMVGLLSVDPARIIGLLDTPRIRRLWQEAAFEIAPPRIPDNSGWGWYAFPSAPDHQASAGLLAALDACARRKPVGAGVFLGLIAGVGLLALLVGPVDAIVLKRFRKSHLSWASALGWTALACGIALAAPTLLRSGGSQYGRFRIVDTLALDPPVSASTHATGIYAASATRIGLLDEGPGTFSRGVSALDTWASSSATFAPLRVSQRSSLADPSLRESVATDLSLGQWTFRTLLTQTPARIAPLAPTGRIEGTLSSGTVVLRNLPAEAEIDVAWMRIGSRFHGLTLDDEPADTSPTGLRTRRASIVPPPPPAPPPTADGLVRVEPGQVDVSMAVSSADGRLAMVGPSQRASAAEHRQAAGWATVFIRIHSRTRPEGAHRGVEHFEHALHRIAIPLPPGFQDSSTDGATP